MSTNYYLFSPSRKKRVMIGSVGLSGVQSFPASPDVIAFVRWAIDEALEDVAMVSEHKLDMLDDDSDYFEISP